MSGELIYSTDILAPKHKISLSFKSKIPLPNILRNMPEILSRTLDIPLHRVYEPTFMWDVSGEPVDIYCKWVVAETELDPHSVIRIIVEIFAKYDRKTGEAWGTINIKGFIDTTFHYTTIIDKKFKEAFMKTLYKKRRAELRKIGRIYMEKIEKTLRELFRVEVRAT